MRPKSTTLTRQELEIMKVIWRLKKGTVRDVYEALLQERKIAYTTVMTMMKILEQKEYLRKNKSDRAYVYEATRPQQRVLGAMVKDFIDHVFNGAAKPLLVHLIEDRRLSDKDIEEIRQMIRKQP